MSSLRESDAGPPGATGGATPTEDAGERTIRREPLEEERRFPLRFGLLGRIALALALVGLLPLGLTSVRLIAINRDAMLDQVLTTHSLAARTAAARVQARLESVGALAQGAASHPAFAQPRSEAARLLLSESLVAWAEQSVLAVALLDTAGREVLRAQVRRPGIDGRVAGALGTEPGASIVAIPREAGLSLRLEAELVERPGRLALVVDGAALAGLVEPWEIGEQADLVLVDSSRRILVGSRADLESFPPDLVQVALAGSTQGARRFESVGVVGAWSQVPGTSWTVLSRQPLRIAEATAIRMRRQSLGAVGGALTLIVLLSGLAWVSVVRPVRSLLAAERRWLPAGEQRAVRGNELTALRSVVRAAERGRRDRRALTEVFLGRYQVLEVIGSGGMGTVFRGWDPRLRREVALKTVGLGGGAPGERVAELLREAILAARFSHPNIVSIYDVADHPEAAFLAMELVDGLGLDGLLSRVGRLSVERTVCLGAAVASALAAAHDRGIVHRDVKPANILVAWDGAIKVSDFGIAELVSAAEERTEEVYGTPGYLAPETLTGGGFEPRSDLFALGAVLYRCLTATDPFAGRGMRDTMRKTLNGSLDMEPLLDIEMPPELAALLLRLLDRDRERRPDSAGAVATALEEMAAAHGYRWSSPLERGREEREPVGMPAAPSRWLPTRRPS